MGNANSNRGAADLMWRVRRRSDHFRNCRESEPVDAQVQPISLSRISESISKMWSYWLAIAAVPDGLTMRFFEDRQLHREKVTVPIHKSLDTDMNWS